MPRDGSASELQRRLSRVRGVGLQQLEGCLRRGGAWFAISAVVPSCRARPPVALGASCGADGVGNKCAMLEYTVNVEDSRMRMRLSRKFVGTSLGDGHGTDFQ